MKTQLRNGLKNLLVSAIVAGSLNIAVQAQPKNESDMLKNSAEQEKALSDLNEFATQLKSSVIYTAPVEFVDPVVQDLEQLASTTMEEIMYKTPDGSDNTIERTENHHMASLKHNRKPVKVEVYRSGNEQWLINAGYYKSDRTKNRNRQLASRF